MLSLLRTIFLTVWIAANEVFSLFYWAIFFYLWEVALVPVARRIGLSHLFITKVQLDSGIATGLKGFGYTKFEAIRYARAQRFQLPQSLSTDFARNLNTRPNCFPQSHPGMGSYDRFPMIKSFLQVSREAKAKGYFGSEEDGHQLNIWTPNELTSVSARVFGGSGARNFTTEKKQLRPVLVIFHGGAFVYSSCHQVYLDGTSWAQKMGYVVVSVNYRLGLNGFLFNEGMDKNQIASNIGLRDQIFSLQWVKKNIHKFGGDASQVTIAGESAGAMSCAFLCACEEVIRDNLVHKAWMMSGSNQNIMTPNQASRIYYDVARRLGVLPCPTVDDPKKFLMDEVTEEEKKNFDHAAFASLLRSIPSSELIRIQIKVAMDVTRAYRNCYSSILMPFHPALDGDLFKSHPLLQMKELTQKYNKTPIPCFLGTCDSEYTFFVNLSPSSPDTAKFHPIDDSLLINRLRAWTAECGGKHALNDRSLQNVIECYQAGNCRKRQGPNHDVWVGLNGDFTFRMPVQNFASHMGGNHNFVYCYGNPNDILRNLKAPHVSDLPYFFDLLRIGQPFSGFWNPARIALKNKMMQDVDNFMRGRYDRLWVPWNDDEKPVFYYDCRVPSSSSSSTCSGTNNDSPYYSGLVLNPDAKEIEAWQPICHSLIHK